MSSPEIDYEAIRRRVEARTERWFGFLRRLGSAITINLIVWGIWFVTGHSGDSGMPWLAFVILVSVVALARHAVRVFLTPTLDAYQDREVQREIEREKARLGLDEADEDDNFDEKPKRGDVPKRKRSVRLGDDGELVEDYEDDNLEESSTSEITN